jgi:hypothetical protein
MKLIQTGRGTRRGVEDLVQFLRPLAFNEHAKQSELSEPPGESKKRSTMAKPLCKPNDQGLKGQHITELSLREAYTVWKPISKLAAPLGSSGFETSSLRPKSLEGGNRCLEKPAPSVMNSNPHITEHDRGEDAGEIVCESNDFGGEYYEPLASIGGFGPVTTDNFKPEGSFFPAFGTSDLLSSPLAWAPNLYHPLSQDTEPRGNYTTGNSTHRGIGRFGSVRRRDKPEIVVQTQVLAVPSYQGAQVVWNSIALFSISS